MLRLLLIFICCAQFASAKGISLLNIPHDYSFLTETESGPYIIDYIGIEDGLYRFDTTTPTTTESHWTLWRNEKSQALRATDNSLIEHYTPNDCLNVKGDCNFEFDWGNGDIDDVFNRTRVKGKITYIEYYIVYENGPAFWYLDCVTYDSYGFTIDMYQIDFEGNVAWQQRTSSSTNENSQVSTDKLGRLCQAAYDARQEI